MEHFMEGLKNFKDIEGRSTRKQYWMYTLFAMIAIIPLGLMLAAIHPVLAYIPSIVLFIPAVSIAIRRLHDTGRSGWWLLLALIPLVSLVLIYFFVQDSCDENEYGPNPKEATY